MYKSISEIVNINRVAIWRATLAEEINVKISPPGRHYLENNVEKISDQEMYRYVKNYKVGKGESAIDFCLFIITFSDSINHVEKFLDEVAKTIKPEYAKKVVDESNMTNFAYLDEFYKEKE